jgi:hypothetical protein
MNLRVVTTAVLSLLISGVVQAAYKNEIFITTDNRWNLKMTEKGTPEYDHSSGFTFLGGSGLGFGYRGGFDFDGIGLGIDAQYGWKDEASGRKAADGSGTNTDYDYQTFRLMAGPYLAAIFSPSFRLLVEYFPVVNSNVHYSDEKTENPFRKGDVLKGTGYSAGFAYHAPSLFSLTVLYRQVTYNDIQTNGVSHKLPDASFSELVNSEIAGQIGVHF